MKKELDEDVFFELKEMAEDIHLVSRNYNDELIGIDYYSNLSVLTPDELRELEVLWHTKVHTCHKEKLASQWMVIQIFLIISSTSYLASVSGGLIVGTIVCLFGMIAMIAMIEDKRVANAKRNLKDAIKVHQHLQTHMSRRSDISSE